MPHRLIALSALAAQTVLFWVLSPNAVSQAPLPPGTALVSRTESAMKRLGSVHITISSRGGPALPGTSQSSVSGMMDVSLRQRRVHYVAVTRSSGTAGYPGGVLRNEYIVVGNRMAQHYNNYSWGSERGLSPGEQQQLYTFTPFLSGRALKEKTIGAGRLRGIAVWRVRIVLDPRHTALGPMVLSIAQDNYRLVRERLTLGNVKVNPGREALILDYSRYGELVNVQLPRACSQPLSDQVGV